MTTILSTKKLSLSQRQLLLNANIAVADVDFIVTKNLDFRPNQQVIENAIFTSKKSVGVVLSTKVHIKNCFCVGSQTEQLLLQNNQHVVCCKPNAKELGEAIVLKYGGFNFFYFCAEKRLDILPQILNSNKINWEEVPVYKTVLAPKKYHQKFDGVLFFSPSGVKSFFSVNTEPKHSFCIGNTTATSLKKYTKNYTVASQPSVENVIVKAVKYFKKND